MADAVRSLVVGGILLTMVNVLLLFAVEGVEVKEEGRKCQLLSHA